MKCYNVSFDHSLWPDVVQERIVFGLADFSIEHAAIPDMVVSHGVYRVGAAFHNGRTVVNYGNTLEKESPNLSHRLTQHISYHCIIKKECTCSYP